VLHDRKLPLQLLSVIIEDWVFLGSVGFRDIVDGIATGYELHYPGFKSRQRQELFCSTQLFRPELEPTQSRVPWVLERVCTGGKSAGAWPSLPAHA
jgi:hypothetical protein